MSSQIRSLETIANACEDVTAESRAGSLGPASTTSNSAPTASRRSWRLEMPESALWIGPTRRPPSSSSTTNAITRSYAPSDAVVGGPLFVAVPAGHAVAVVTVGEDDRACRHRQAESLDRRRVVHHPELVEHSRVVGRLRGRVTFGLAERSEVLR